jgi:fumarate reductase flavoprotein subunit
MDVDVVVAGAGAAGLSAAIAAAQGGRSVLLLERSETFREGCCTSMSTAMIPAAGTRWQAAADVDDDAACFAADIARKTKGTADSTATKALTAVGPALVDWLADGCGVPLELVTDFLYPGHSRHRCHTVADRAGSTLLRQLLEAAQRTEGLELVAPMRLVDVELDPATGQVRAAIGETPDGARERVETAAVVLATCGFGADAELVRRHCPEIAGGLYHGGDGATGDGLRIGERLGAATAYLDAYQGHGSVADPHSVIVTWATVVHGGVIVNARGERFGDESTGYSEFARQVIAQPGSVAWTLIDERIEAALEPFADWQRLRAAGAIRRAAGVEELAALIGCAPASLATTLAAADGCARAAAAGLPAADTFGRTSWGAALAAPYVAVRITGALFHTQGGLRTDGHARVLRPAGDAIPGLYAAGGAAQGISGHGADGYLAGNGLLGALGLGFLAGSHLAR